MQSSEAGRSIRGEVNEWTIEKPRRIAAKPRKATGRRTCARREGSDMKRLIAGVLLILTVAALTAEKPSAYPDLQSLSGVLKEGMKSEFRFYLEFDGMTGSMNLDGAALADYKIGDHVMVKGVIRTRLWNPKADGTPQQQPAHWSVFMEVREAKAIKSLFGLNERA